MEEQIEVLERHLKRGKKYFYLGMLLAIVSPVGIGYASYFYTSYLGDAFLFATFMVWGLSIMFFVMAFKMNILGGQSEVDRLKIQVKQWKD